MPIVKVEVTKEDLGDQFPVAKALARHLDIDTEYEISIENLYLEKNGKAAQVDWSGTAQHFLSRIEDGLPIPPFDLEVFIPDEFLRKEEVCQS